MLQPAVYQFQLLPDAINGVFVLVEVDESFYAFDPDTRPERTGWRDQDISGRHRIWGFNCPAVDLDFLMVEYNFGKPSAIVEYKHYRARQPDMRHATYRALISLANSSEVPFYLAFYWPEIWAFKVNPANDFAFQWFEDGELMNERMYVERMYAIRNRTVEREVLAGLHTQLPGWETDHELWDAVGVNE